MSMMCVRRNHRIRTKTMWIPICPLLAGMIWAVGEAAGIFAPLAAAQPANAAGANAAGAASATRVAQRPETRMVSPRFFGMQMHTLRWGDPASHARSAGMAAALGARFVRDEAHWDLIEQQKGVMRIPDTTLANFKTNKRLGLETLLILNYANKFYDNGDAPATPEAAEAFGRYCYFMARELKGLCRYFEVWNEPNTDGFWAPRKDPAAYARLMAVAIREVKRANPDAIVFGGALSTIDGDFMRDVCAAASAAGEGGCAAMDVLSIHPYCTPASPGEADIFARMDAVRRAVFPGAGAERPPLWVTEIGYPTNIGNGVSERRQAEMIAQTYLIGMTRPELEGVVWYWLGPDGPDAEWAEDRFGVFHPEWKGLKPSAYAFATLARVFSGSTVATRIDPVDGLPEVRVVRGTDVEGHPLAALYCERGACTVAARRISSLEVIPLTGAAPVTLRARRETGEAMQLTITPLPLIVRAENPNVKMEFSAPFMPMRLEQASGRATIARGDWAEYAARVVPLPDAASPSTRALAVAGILAPEADPTTTPLRISTAILPAEWNGHPLAANPSGEKASAGNGQPAEWTPAAALRFEALAADPAQELPVAAYYTAPGAQSPCARLSTAVRTVDPVEIKARPEWSKDGKPMIRLEARLHAAHPTDFRGLMSIGGVPVWQDANLHLSGEGIFGIIDPIPPLKSPDDVLDAKIRLTTQKGVESNWTFILSYMKSHQTPRAPSIDGDLSDWPRGLPPIRLGEREQFVAERLPWGGPSDASALVWTAWDAEWFYIAAELRDDILGETSFGTALYQNDGLEVYLDTDRERGRYAADFGPNQFQYGLFPCNGKDVVWEWHHGDAASPGSRIRINRSPRPEQRLPGSAALAAADARMGGDIAPRLIIEAAIPMNEIHLKPAPGMELGFTVALDDDDTPGYVHPFLQDLQMQWSRQKYAWRTPSAFASLWLAGPFEGK